MVEPDTEVFGVPAAGHFCRVGDTFWDTPTPPGSFGFALIGLGLSGWGMCRNASGRCYQLPS